MRKTALFAAVLVATLTFVVSSKQVSAAKERPAENDTKKSSKVITVQAGDTLSKIAKKNGTTYKRLFFANKKIQNPDLIYPGQKLRIPKKNEKLKSRPLGYVASAPIAYQPVDQTNYTVPASQPVQQTASSSASGDVWDQLAACESGGNWQINTGNGYYGGLQFTASSWAAVGGQGLPHQASKSEQIKRAQMLQASQGWGAWPACSAQAGLR